MAAVLDLSQDLSSGKAAELHAAMRNKLQYVFYSHLHGYIVPLVTACSVFKLQVVICVCTDVKFAEAKVGRACFAVGHADTHPHGAWVGSNYVYYLL